VPDGGFAAAAGAAAPGAAGAPGAFVVDAAGGLVEADVLPPPSRLASALAARIAMQSAMAAAIVMSRISCPLDHAARNG
jgi:hypothetical protein